MIGWTVVALTMVITTLAALWMWAECREGVSRMTVGEAPRWEKASRVLCAALGGAIAVVGIAAAQAARAAAERQ